MSSVHDVGRILDGLTPRRVQQLVNDGVLPRPGDRGEYDLVKCVIAYIRYLKKLAHGTGEISLTDARTRLAKEQADRLEMENRKIRGETILVRDAAKYLEAVVVAIRQKILGMGDRITPRVVGCNSYAEVKRLIDDSGKEILLDIVQIDPVRALELGASNSDGAGSGGSASRIEGERVG